MFVKLFATKDTFITDHFIGDSSDRATGSNMGKSEILDVFADKNRLLNDEIELGRILIYFDLTPLDKYNIDYASFSASLLLYNSIHSLTQPSSFDLYIHPVTKLWDEGNGLDHFTTSDTSRFLDRGYANWMSASSVMGWANPGGDYDDDYSGSMHFDTGYEDLECNITDTLLSQLTGSLTNYGYMVKLGILEETNDVDYFIKMFYSAQSHNYDKRPQLVIYWDDLIEDDRANLVKGQSQNLFLYNKFNEEYIDLSISESDIKVNITTLPNMSGSIIISSGSASKFNTGIYETSFIVPFATSGSILYDYWIDTANNQIIASGSFNILSDTSKLYEILQKKYVVNISNLHRTYNENEVVTLRVMTTSTETEYDHLFSQPYDGAPRILKNMYFEISNLYSEEIIIPISDKTKLSYDYLGNFFTLDMSMFSEGEVYKIQFYSSVSGELKKLITDQEFIFKLV